MQLKITILASMLALGSACFSAKADSVPKPICAAISSHLVEVRIDGDLSSLTERERANLAHYLDRVKASGKRLPFQVYIFHGTLPWEPELRLSLIFPTKKCDQEKCFGTAILPNENMTDVVRFAYRNNLIVEPYRGSTSIIAGFQERDATSYIFMDDQERKFIAFHDVHRLPLDVPWNPGTIKHAKPIRSIASIIDTRPSVVQPSRPNYKECFKNMFEASGFIPAGTPRTRSK
jgi:hypothetical protein